MPTDLDRIIRDVAATHPSLGRLNDILSIRGDDPEADAQLERYLLAADRGLIVRVYRAFGMPLPPPPVSLGRAVQEIGWRPVHSAAIATAVASELGHDGGGVLRSTPFWRNAAAVGVLGVLTATTDGMNHDQTFAAGLLHRLGLLLLDQHAPSTLERSIERSEREDIGIDDAVREVAGFSLPELAGAAALRWNLPPWLSEVCAYPAGMDDVVGSPRKLGSQVARARMAAVVRGFGEEVGRTSAPESGLTWLVERPLLALDRLGGESWLARRVDAVLSVALYDRDHR